MLDQQHGNGEHSQKLSKNVGVSEDVFHKQKLQLDFFLLTAHNHYGTDNILKPSFTSYRRIDGKGGGKGGGWSVGTVPGRLIYRTLLYRTLSSALPYAVQVWYFVSDDWYMPYTSIEHTHIHTFTHSYAHTHTHTNTHPWGPNARSLWPFRR